MHRRTLNRFLALVISAGAIAANAQQVPSIAVTDLAYTQRVAEFFVAGRKQSSAQVQASGWTITGSADAKSTYVAGVHSYLEQSELGSFSSDIRGALLRGTSFRLIQGKTFNPGPPQPTKAEQALNQLQTGTMAQPVVQPEVKDIVNRINKGEFNGADYVLFGTLSSLQFRDQFSPIQGTTSTSHIYGLDLLADYALIDTRTLEIKASFSAQGAGSDTKLLSNRGDVMPPNRAKVMRETSLSLAQSVYEQVVSQLALSDPAMARGVRATAAPTRGGQPVTTAPGPSTNQVIIYK